MNPIRPSRSPFLRRLPAVFLLAFPLFLQAQWHAPRDHAWEMGVMFGVIQYSGDVAEKRFEISETHAGYGGFFRYRMSPKFAVKAHLYGGVITGDDRNSPRKLIKRRSFYFASSILEAGLVGEWFILGQPHFNGSFHNRHVTPVVFLGVAGTFTNNDAVYGGAPEDRNRFLKVPLPEPGLAHQFVCFPMGIGVRYDLNERIILGAEAGARLMLSDEIDGISRNGNPNHNDWYYFGGATITYVLGPLHGMN